MGTQNSTVHFDVLGRLDELSEQKGYTRYQLAKFSGIPQSTIATWYQKRLYPPVDKLERLCNAMGITLGTFFNTDKSVYLTDCKERELLKQISLLSSEDQRLIHQLIDRMVRLQGKRTKEKNNSRD